MSGKPSPEGVELFRQAMTQMANSRARLAVLTEEIKTRNIEMLKKQDEYRTASKTLFDLMEKMDVAARGNYGYEGRFSWFITELHDQLVTQSAAVGDGRPSGEWGAK